MVGQVESSYPKSVKTYKEFETLLEKSKEQEKFKFSSHFFNISTLEHLDMLVSYFSSYYPSICLEYYNCLLNIKDKLDEKISNQKSMGIKVKTIAKDLDELAKDDISEIFEKIEKLKSLLFVPGTLLSVEKTGSSRGGSRKTKKTKKTRKTRKTREASKVSKKLKSSTKNKPSKKSKKAKAPRRRQSRKTKKTEKASKVSTNPKK